MHHAALAIVADVDPAAWEGFLNRWGVPVVILALMGLALWRIARKVEPWADQIVKSHISLVDTLTEKLGTIEKNSDSANEMLAQIDRHLRERDQR